MFAARQTLKQNRLLAALPSEDCGRLACDLQLVALQLGRVLYEAGRHSQQVYFPTTSIVSMLYLTQDGESAEFAVAGNDGLVGFPSLMGGETTPSRAVVQSAGYAYQLEAEVLRREFERGGPLQHVLLRYTQALITQIAQIAVCNRYHTVDQQLCRW